jgi:RNA 2',3'-cyclic 3'-phosphodiesterase
MIRAFLAVELSPGLRAELAALQQELRQSIEQEMKQNRHISWVQPAKMHLTIKFLGDMDEQLLDPLLGVLEQALGSQPSMSMPLERLGVFPRPHSPRVLWIGPSEHWERGTEAKKMVEIRDAIEEASESLGFLREAKPFSPHLTMARIKTGERHVGAVLATSGVLDQPLSLGSLAVGSVVLVKSELKPTGSVYTRLWEARLRDS